jgi:hypothetical protein
MSVTSTTARAEVLSSATEALAAVRAYAASIASHDPVSWKYHHVGNFPLNHALPPNHGQL